MSTSDSGDDSDGGALAGGLRQGAGRSRQPIVLDEQLSDDEIEVSDGGQDDAWLTRGSGGGGSRKRARTEKQPDRAPRQGRPGSGKDGSNSITSFFNKLPLGRRMTLAGDTRAFGAPATYSMTPSIQLPVRPQHYTRAMRITPCSQLRAVLLCSGSCTHCCRPCCAPSAISELCGCAGGARRGCAG